MRSIYQSRPVEESDTRSDGPEALEDEEHAVPFQYDGGECKGSIKDTVQTQALHMLCFHDSGCEARLQILSMDPVPIMRVEVPSGPDTRGGGATKFVQMVTLH